MLGYTAAEVMNKITPADISDPQELIARATALSVELGTPITPGFEALVFKASRGIEDIYELTYIRKDGSRFPAVVSVTALRDAQNAIIGYLLIGTDNTARKQAEEALLKAGALQSAIFNSANFSSIATDAKGVIQIFNVGAERMLGYTAAEVMNKITPADISDPQELIARATALSVELGTPITPGFEALVFKASRGIEDIYELTYIRKDGSRFPAVVSVTALRDAQNAIIGYLLIGTDNTARKQAEEALLKAGALQSAIFNSANFSSIATDAKGVIQIFNVGAERMLGYTAAEVMNKITPADISDPQEVIARAKALSVELGTPITPGFEALVFKASRGIEDIYELTYIRKDGSRFPAVVSVTALRDAQDAIIGYLLIGTELKAGALQSAIFNSANFSSIATDAKGVIQIFNVGAERMLGYTAAEVMNKITPADISDPQEVIARAKALSVELATTITPGFEALVFKASRGIEDIYELTYIRKDGSRFPAVVSVTALRDAQDAIIGYLLIGTDNTARKQVEEERQKLDQRLRDQQFYTRSLIESNIDAIMTTDPSGIITDVNKQMEALTGCTRDELIGAPFKNYFTDPERAEAAIKLVLSEKKVTDYELTARARDGKETVVSYNATTFYDRDRKLQGVFAAARDVTERKQAEQELSEKARLLDLSNDAIIVRDLDDKISSWNKGAEKLYGWASEEVIGKHLDSLLQMEFPKPMEEILAQLQSEGEFSGEVVQIVRDGRRVAALCRWVLDRGTESILTSYTDITERRMLEDSLVARASDLVRADRSKDEFLAMLAHELRNPLAPLRNAAEILRTPDANGEAREQAQSILARQIENMSRMIDDLLDVSRITEGKIELRKQPVALEAHPHCGGERRAAGDRCARPGARDRAAGRPDLFECGRHAPRSGLRQSPRECLQIQQLRLSHLTQRRARRRPWKGTAGGHRARARQRHRHRARAVAAHFRSLRASHPRAGSRAWRAGHRPHPRAAAREAARWQRRGAQRGSWPRE